MSLSCARDPRLPFALGKRKAGPIDQPQLMNPRNVATCEARSLEVIRSKSMQTDPLFTSEPGSDHECIRHYMNLSIRPCHPPPGHPSTFRATQVPNVQWDSRPIRPSDAFMPKHDSSKWQRRPLVQGVPIQYVRTSSILDPPTPI